MAIDSCQTHGATNMTSSKKRLFPLTAKAVPAQFLNSRRVTAMSLNMPISQSAFSQDSPRKVTLIVNPLGVYQATALANVRVRAYSYRASQGV